MNNVWNQEELDPFWLVALLGQVGQIKVVDCYDPEDVYWDSEDGEDDIFTCAFRIMEACRVAEMCYIHVYRQPLTARGTHDTYDGWIQIIWDGPQPHLSDYSVRLQDIIESCDSWAADIHTCKRQVSDLLSETNS